MRCLDKRRPTPVLDHRFVVILPRRNYSGRPVMRVRPIIGVPDSTTTDGDGSNSETTDVDVETVEESDEEAPAEGWEEGYINPLS